MNLSKRMETVVNLVSPQSFAIADIGCDHAYVSIEIIKRNLATKVIAMDVRKGPLEIATKNIKQAGFEGQIDIRLSDGLEKLKQDEVDTIIIAGMGGLLITNILEKGKNIFEQCDRRPELILQPQSELFAVRKYLFAHKYNIICEKMLVEEGKYYTVMKAVPMDEQISDAGQNVALHNESLTYGAYLLQEKNEILCQYLQSEHAVLAGIVEKLEKQEMQAVESGKEFSPKTKARLCEVKEQLCTNEKALDYFS